MKRILIIAILALLLPALVFAQSSTGGRSRGSSTYTLTVTCNVQNALVQITAEGADSSKLGGASGRAPFTQQLAAGNYTVTVSAAGHNPQTRTISLNADQTVNFNLVASNYSLNIRSNIPGARVRLQGNGRNLNGNTDMSVELPPGTYQVAVAAPGYEAQAQQVVLNGNQTVTFVLQPVTSKVAIILGPALLNPRLGNPAAQVKVFDNGQLLRNLVSDLNPGQHTIRVESGGFVFETTLVLEPGKEYRIEPYGGFIVNGQRM